MKKLILLVFVSCMLFACNDWLTVSSDDELLREDAFADYKGHRNALNGIYQEISDVDMYGRELMWGFLSALGQNYPNGACGSIYAKALAYDYENTSIKYIIQSIWEKCFRTIADCNSLIERVQECDTSFYKKGYYERNMILGEAIGMRAFLHFEILRMFAPAPIVQDEGHYIPYVEKYPSHGEPRLTVRKTLEKIIVDLEQAKELLVKGDTLINPMESMIERFKNLGLTEGGMFFSARGTRMNYFAVCALLARVYLYAGDKQKAYDNAYEVYKYGPEKEEWFSFTNPWNIVYATVPPKRYEGILLAFYNTDALKLYKQYKTSTGALFKIANMGDLFKGDFKDYRMTHFMYQGESIEWLEMANKPNVNEEQGPLLPIIRMSEVYYILAETSFEKDRKFAISCLNFVKEARGANPISEEITDEDTFMDYLVKDATREFLTEGQTFFLYKRLNRKMYNGASGIDMVGKYVFPIPESDWVR